MTTTFASQPQFFYTSESVTEGHPDKMCDRDLGCRAGCDHCRKTRAPRVACECSATTGLVLVMGEITTKTYVNITSIVRDTVRGIGYTRAKFGFDADTCGVIVSIKEQSPDIALGVDRALEAKRGEMSDAEIEATGAGDQGMMFGFACTETENYMPLSIDLAHKLCKQMARVRKDEALPYLRPDGKSQVTVEYSCGKPVRVDTVVISTQHSPDVEHAKIEADMYDRVIKYVVPNGYLDARTKIYVNPTGRFVYGGPAADSGLTGRKIIVDTYGGVARHGGGSFSGKDPTKVDRSASYMLRYVAKNLVAAGVADRLEIQVSYAIGVARPLSIAVETYGTGKIGDDAIVGLVNNCFDLRPAAIIQNLDLRRPIYKATAAYGHFGRTDIDAPWEKLDRVQDLKRAAGL